MSNKINDTNLDLAELLQHQMGMNNSQAVDMTAHELFSQAVVMAAAVHGDGATDKVATAAEDSTATIYSAFIGNNAETLFFGRNISDSMMNALWSDYLSQQQ